MLNLKIFRGGWAPGRRSRVAPLALLLALAAAQGCAYYREQAQARYLAEARQFERKGSHERAVGAYDAALRIQPTSLPVELERLGALARAGHAARARMVCDDLLLRFPKDARVHYAAGHLAFDAGRFAEAERSFAEACALDPKYVDAWVALGRMAMADGRRDDARAAYACVPLGPSTGRALVCEVTYALRLCEERSKAPPPAQVVPPSTPPMEDAGAADRQAMPLKLEGIERTLRAVDARDGRKGDFPAVWALALLLPLIGGLGWWLGARRRG